MSPKAKERQLVMNFRTNHLSLLGVICMSVSTEIKATTTNNLFEFSDIGYFDSLKNNFHCSLSCQLCNSGNKEDKIILPASLPPGKGIKSHWHHTTSQHIPYIHKNSYMWLHNRLHTACTLTTSSNSKQIHSCNFHEYNFRCLVLIIHNLVTYAQTGMIIAEQ